jgi:sulfur relay (sulfurtransferase) DsrC/TusE family protein
MLTALTVGLFSNFTRLLKILEQFYTLYLSNPKIRTLLKVQAKTPVGEFACHVWLRLHDKSQRP